MKLTPEREKQAELEAQRIVETTERERKASVVIAIVCLPIFVLWMAFCIYLVKLGILTEWYMWVGGPVTGLLGIVFCGYGLWKNGNKEHFWERERAKIDKILAAFPADLLFETSAEAAELMKLFDN